MLLVWLPSFFELALGVNVEKSSILILIPYVTMIAMMPLVCFLCVCCVAVSVCVCVCVCAAVLL